MVGKPRPRAKAWVNDMLKEDPKVATAEAKAVKSCKAGKCKAVPATNNLSVRVSF